MACRRPEKIRLSQPLGLSYSSEIFDQHAEHLRSLSKQKQASQKRACSWIWRPSPSSQVRYGNTRGESYTASHSRQRGKNGEGKHIKNKYPLNLQSEPPNATFKTRARTNSSEFAHIKWLRATLLCSALEERMAQKRKKREER